MGSCFLGTGGNSVLSMPEILCIEDEPDLCEDLADELAEAGYQVRSAHDGRTGLRMALEHAPDLIISDINMPGMTGDQVLDELRSIHPQARSIPFVFLSAHSDRADILKGIRLGADDYLVKPVDFELLLAKVETLLRRSRPASGKSWQADADVFRSLDAAGTVEEVSHVLLNQMASYGCEWFIIGAPPMPGRHAEPIVLAQKWPDGYFEHYVGNRFMDCDPVLWHGLRMNTPFHWSEAPLIRGREEKGRAMLEAAKGFGLVDGIVVPIIADDGTQFLASFSGRRVEVPESHVMPVSILLHYAYNRLVALNGGTKVRPGELSERERQVVGWAAYGKTNEDIADILGISARTVIMHLQNASTKLNASNRASLVAEAIRYKQIQI